MSTVDTGYIPNNGELEVGGYTTSPDGLYYGIMTASGFGVVPGSNPVIASCCSTGLNILPIQGGPDFGGFFVHMQTDGNFVIYTSSSGFDQGPVVAVAATNSVSNNPPYFAQVSDTGSFTIGFGTDPAHSTGTNFSNSGINSPVTSIDLTDIQYSNILPLLTTLQPIPPFVNINDTGQPQQFNDVVTYTRTTTDTYSFSTSATTGHTIQASAGFNVFGVTGSLSYGVTNSTTVTDGQATSQSFSVAEAIGARPTVPANSQYTVTVTATQAEFEIPFTWDGVATYQNGVTANVTGTGMYAGKDIGGFVATITCDYYHGSSSDCPGTVTQPEVVDVPEPPMVALLPMALLALLLTRRCVRPGRAAA